MPPKRGANAGRSGNGGGCGVVRVTICALTTAPLAVILMTMYHAPSTLSRNSGPPEKITPKSSTSLLSQQIPPIGSDSAVAVAGKMDSAHGIHGSERNLRGDEATAKSWNPLADLGNQIVANDPPKHPGDAFGRAAGALYDEALNASVSNSFL